MKPEQHQSDPIAIEARNTSKIFGVGEHAVRALDDVSVALRQGEFFTLLGPSGCGKTTLLRLFAGFETPTSGTILLNGEDVTEQPPNRRRVNTVFQNYALFPHLSVAQNIAFGLEMLGRPKADIAATVDEMLALVRMTDMASRRTSQISGGQQQRVALARALAPGPDVLLLDEPLSALDLQLRKEMQVELKRLQSETGITFVFVTHDQEEALTMSDRIGVMQAGKILQIGSPRDIYDRPANRFVAGFIGESNFMPGRVESVEAGMATVALACGGTARVEGNGAQAAGSQVTLAVRPEQVQLVPQETKGCLAATVADAIYFGTDTHFHLRLPQDIAIVARKQNPPGQEAELKPGDRTGIVFADGAVRMLGD